MSSLTDKNALMQVLGCLIKKPIILADRKYIFTKNDFNTPLSQNIFQVVYNLFTIYHSEEITIIDIDNYLQQNEGVYNNFKNNNGIQYLNDCVEISNLASFDYYYDRIKKLSALRALKKNGFDIKDIIDENELDVNKEKKQLENLDKMKIEEIFNKYLITINDLQNNFVCKDDSELGLISDGIENLIGELEQNPEIGTPIQGNIYNTLVRGARRKKFYLISGTTGAGKTRQMVGHACTIAYPEIYDVEKNEWIVRGKGQKILFFATEMEKDEIQTMILAYISGVNEDKILNNSYETFEERERIKEAIKIMTYYKDNFIFIRVGDPNVNQIKTLIRQQVLKYKIQYVFYDYIFSSPNLLSEFRDYRIREDVALLLLSTALKDLANELNIFMMSGTQLNDKWKEWKGIRDQNLIRGSKAVVDKADVAGISLPLTEEDHNLIDKVIIQQGFEKPTHVQDLYKVRRGKYTRVRIWSKADLGTCRTKDLFLTDANGQIINIVINEYLYTDNSNKIIKQSELVSERKEDKEMIQVLEDKTINKEVSLSNLI